MSTSPPRTLGPRPPPPPPPPEAERSRSRAAVERVAGWAALVTMALFGLGSIVLLSHAVTSGVLFAFFWFFFTLGMPLALILAVIALVASPHGGSGRALAKAALVAFAIGWGVMAVAMMLLFMMMGSSTW